MSLFTGPLSITEVSTKTRRWVLNEPLAYEVGAEGSGRWVVAPAGMETDGASVPRLFWTFLPAWDTYSRAAVIHDHLCAMLAAGAPHAEGRTYRQAATVFREAMKVCRTPWLTRWSMWAAVRLWFFATGR